MTRVYFIKPVGMDGPIKIGCSVSPDGRRQTLAVWSPFALEIVAEIEGNFQMERRFHARHLASRERGEWFTATELLKADIASIRAGTFDAAVLPDPIKLPTGKKGGGRKWTEQEKLAAAQRRAVYAITKQTGLVPDCANGDDRVALFLADPERNGITRREAFVRGQRRLLEWEEQNVAERRALIASAAA